MSFFFSFIPSEENGVETSHGDASLEHDSKDHRTTRPFVWLNDTFSRFLRLCSLPPVAHELIALHDHEEESSVPQYLVRVSERSKAFTYKGTDLVPGEYEGGDVVWECSLDLCRYLHRNAIKVRGYVLELGCGHGLPGCWVLSQARKETDAYTSVCFTDYNEFVLDATLANIVLNISPEHRQGARSNIARWLAEHAPLGSGDWNELSRLLQLSTSGANGTMLPTGLPSDGLFDCILAAETTYSASAAAETARFVINHLRCNGVAYIATKRYYFGVGGGSDAFREGIVTNVTGEGEFHVDTIEVYDNGCGNIRELLRVQRRSL
jgi:hypothetical protein